MYKIEYENGTDAIRYLNNGYYADKYLLPSVLYLTGIVRHREKKEYITYTPDGSQGDDIPIEGIDVFFTI